MPSKKEIDPFVLPEETSLTFQIDHRIYTYSENAKSIINKLVKVALINDDLNLRTTLKRYRKRPNEMITRLSYCLEIYLSNLVYLSCDYGLETSLRVSRSKKFPIKNRYKPEAFTIGAAIAAQDILSLPENDLISMVLGIKDLTGRHSTQTILKPSEKLLKAVKTLSKSDFSHNAPQEIIILKHKEKDDAYSERPKGNWADYEDTDFTNNARRQLRTINCHLSRSDIKFNGKALSQDDRQLKRYFNESFDTGGRIFGGLWQSVSKLVRKGFTINGESCIEIDFQACGLRLAYARAGLDLNDKFPNDPYLYTGYGRAGIKKMFSAMLCSNAPMKKFPKGLRTDLNIGKHIKIGQITRSIERCFSDVAHLFYNGIGLRLMYTESEILISALVELQAKGVIALPIHDCIMVAKSDQDVASKAMLRAFKEISGQSGKVDIKNLES